MVCRKCKLPIVWRKENGRWYGENPDGSDHWDLCSKVRSAGKVFKEKVAGPFTGKYYKPDGCDCGLPPWELCKPDCVHALDPATPIEMMEIQSTEHLRSLL